MFALKENFARMIYSGFPVLWIDTFEDDRASAIVSEMGRQCDRGVIEWSLKGAGDSESGFAFPKSTLSETLTLFLEQNLLESKILLLKDAHFFLNEPPVISIIKNIAQSILSGNLECTVVIVAPFDTLPKEIESYINVLELDPLDTDAVREIITNFAKNQDSKTPDENLMRKFITHLHGLSRTEIESLLALAIYDGGEFDYNDLEKFSSQKQQLIRKSNILEMIQVNETMADIGGLEKLKGWLQSKAEVFKQIEKAQMFGVDVPKGVLIVGMPGCGKSLTAKAAAKSFEMPLLRMDMGRLMGKYVGDSESNMRRAIKLIEASAPCVLWIDEIEKAFAGVGGNGGGAEVTTRLFGNFLTWMQEKNSLVFIVATANKIDALPPEFLRKGRFDEIFYVALPNLEERKKILAVHINKRRPNDLKSIDIPKIANQTEGYCGADIESIVKDAVESAFVTKKEKISTEDILMAAKNTHSLSDVMSDSIQALKKTYEKLKLKSASA